MSGYVSLLTSVVSMAGKILPYFQNPREVMIDIGKNPELQVASNLMGRGYEFHFFRVDRIREMEGKGWRVAVGRGRLLRPEKYMDKRGELVLMFKSKAR